MQKNRITISVPFSFKGESFTPSCRVDLDALLLKHGELPCLYTHLANVCDIDPYSYEFDVMVMGGMLFEHAEGLAAEFAQEGEFDREGFEARWREVRLHEQLEAIAARHMGIDSLNEAPEVKSALMAAWQLGQSERQA